MQANPYFERNDFEFVFLITEAGRISTKSFKSAMVPGIGDLLDLIVASAANSKFALG